MAQVNITNIRYFLDNRRIELLENYLYVNDSLMPHSIAIATGCEYDEALSLLLLLYGKNLAEGFVLVYHQLHLDVPVDRRPIEEGLSLRGSFNCPICDENVGADNDFYYDLEFILTYNVEFIVQNC